MIAVLFFLVLFYTGCRKNKISDRQSGFFTKFFGKSGYNQGRDVCLTDDGGYLVLGDMSIAGRGTDISLIKTDKYGNEEWGKTYGDNLNDYSEKVVPVSDGYVISGTSYQSSGQTDVMLLKTDKSGNLIWSKKYYKPMDQEGKCLLAEPDGFIITGSTTEESLINLNPAGIKDVLLMKTDNSGNLQWYKSYGGNKDDAGTFVIHKSNDVTSGYLILGNTETYTENGNGSNIILIATNVNGSLTDRKEYGENFNDYGECIQLLSDNSYILIGTTGNSDNSANIFVRKLKNIRDPAWSLTIETGFGTYGKYISETSDKGFILTGTKGNTTSKDLCLIKLSSDGKIEFSKYLGESTGDESGNCVKQTPDGGFIITGTNTFEGPAMITLIKTNASGEQK